MELSVSELLASLIYQHWKFQYNFNCATLSRDIATSVEINIVRSLQVDLILVST